MCRGIPELWVIFEGIWKTYKARRYAGNDVGQNVMRVMFLRVNDSLRSL
jgi:hypothetical protein